MDAPNVALYDDGSLYTSPPEAFAHFEAAGAEIDHITVTGQTLTAGWGDCEWGDLDEYSLRDWRTRKAAAGLGEGGGYCSISRVLNVVAVCGYIGLWTAHYTFVPHICGPDCTDFNGQPYLPPDFPFGLIRRTQYSDRGPNGENYDMSLAR